MPVLTSFGGGTESSKLNSGVEVVVVGAGRAVVTVDAADFVPRAVVGDELGVFEDPLHAQSAATPAISTPPTRFPTSER